MLLHNPCWVQLSRNYCKTPTGLNSPWARHSFCGRAAHCCCLCCCCCPVSSPHDTWCVDWLTQVFPDGVTLLVLFFFRWGPTSVPVRLEWMHMAPGGTYMTPKIKSRHPWTTQPSVCKWAPTRGRARCCNIFPDSRKCRIIRLQWKSASGHPCTLTFRCFEWVSCSDL